MTHLNEMADRLNRTVKLALDTGEAASIEEAERIFAGYRMQLAAGPDVSVSPVLQAALLTAVNCAARTMLGGVTVICPQGSLQVTLPPYTDLEQAVVALGGRIVPKLDSHTPTLVFGDIAEAGIEPLAIRVTFTSWSGGVAPIAHGTRLSESGTFTPAGVLAGALGVSEIFQRLRGSNPLACRRSVGLDLWSPEQDWRRGGSSVAIDRLPSSAWLIGMGNLGQAYLWTLGLLPYGSDEAEFILQDTDVLAESNLSTSLLTVPGDLGRHKTRAMAAWAEMRGFKTSIIERTFAADFRIGLRDPSVALIGVDNALARQAAEDVGFDRVIEAGLGRGSQDFLGIDLHTFPASKTAREVWRETTAPNGDIAPPAYQALLARTKDRCGTIRLANRTIGAPFVGAAAATLVIAELVRLAMGASRYELISCHLRDLTGRLAICGEPWPAFNPGGIPLSGSSVGLSPMPDVLSQQLE